MYWKKLTEWDEARIFTRAVIAVMSAQFEVLAWSEPGKQLELPIEMRLVVIAAFLRQGGPIRLGAGKQIRQHGAEADDAGGAGPRWR